jgi:hypothetical protein
MQKRILLAVLLVVTACAQPSTPEGAPSAPGGLPQLFAAAQQHEAEEPLDPDLYLGVVDAALARPEDPWALPALLASIDALLWRDVVGLSGEHAVAHRSHAGLSRVAKHLRAAWAGGQGGPLLRGIVADGLHDLALRVGAVKDAGKWRQRAGCVRRAVVLGPLAWPALTAIDAPSPVTATGALPASLPGVAPFASVAEPYDTTADACAIALDDASPLAGLRLVVVDVDNPAEQDITVALTSSSAARLELGGVALIDRPYSAGSEWLTRYARAHAPAGRLRLVVRVAYQNDGNRIALQLWGQDGGALHAVAPRPGQKATVTASAGKAIELVPVAGPPELPLALAALLAAGEARAAANLLEEVKGEGAMIDLLRVRALEEAQVLPRNQLKLHVAAAAARALERCPRCWEAKIYVAAAEADKKGSGTGTYAAFAKLGVDADGNAWTASLGPMELYYAAQIADGAGLPDVARVAFDALAARGPSDMLADLDAQLFARHGQELVKAACEGGTSRASTRCLAALSARADLKGALGEMARLRALRGSKAILRDVEISELLAHNETDRAMRIYDVMPAGQRDLGLLGVYIGGKQQGVGRKRFADDMLTAQGAPYGYEPLARLLGVFTDPSAELEREAAVIVARDRENAFLPGAGTAVLRRIESYRLHASGLLHYQVYDLRRVSGTTDVDEGTWMGLPMIEGRVQARMLRRRIYKKDGRVIDPDSTARGQQGNTELAQLQTGDYVEALVAGWGLPDENGQLTVDSPDVLPERTSVREGSIRFQRPKGLPLALWSHALLGAGATSQIESGDAAEEGDVVTVWTMANQAPRRLEGGVPPLEERVGVSFGTDSYERIGRALAARYRALDEDDPFVVAWAQKAVAGETSPEKQIARVVAATGKAIRQSDPSALGDWSAALSGGPQRETARYILEQGMGSRSWVVHRALRALGIESVIAVSEVQPFSAAAGFPPRTGRFAHPLVRASAGGKTIWIDADVDGPPLPPGRVSPELRGRKALLPDGSLVAVQVDAAVDVDEVDMTLKLADSGDATGTFTITLRGRAAQQLADALEVVVGSQRMQMLHGIVLGWLPFADVRSVELTSPEGSWDVAIKADIAMVGFARPEARDKPLFSLPGMQAVHMVFPYAMSTTLGSRYAREAGRMAALVIDSPLFYKVRRRIELPASAKVVALPAPLAIDAPFVNASRKVTADGGALVEELTLSLPVGAVAPQDFDTFAKAIQEIDDGFMHGMRVELPNAPKPEKPKPGKPAKPKPDKPAKPKPKNP